jgi:outer membrane protein assembly factor BamB
MIRFLLLFVLCCVLSGCHLFEKPPTMDPIDAPEIHVQQSWITQAGEGERSVYQRIKPVVDHDTAYVADVKGELIAVDATTGQALWQIYINAGIPSSPSAGGGRIYVGTDQAKVLAFDAKTGDKLWKVDVSNQVLAQPTYVNEQVLVKTLNGELIALDAKTGDEKWRFVEEQPRLILRAHSAAQVSIPFILVGFASGKVVALSADKGQLIWERMITSPSGFSDLARMVDIEADPVIRDGVAYIISYQGNLAAIQMNTARELWRQPISSYSGMVVSNDRLFVSDEAGDVWALDRRTGKTLWRQNLLHDRQITAPQLLDNNVVVADNEGFIHWMDQADGHFVSRQFFSRSGVIAQPVPYQNNLLILSRDGMLVSLHKPKLISRYQT